jgi:two-component sensor histidine kinase
LLLNELISNSLKHAFPDRKEGVIQVRLSQEPNGMFVLVAGDDGIGLPTDFSFKSAHTLGMELVVTLTEQLDGKIQRVGKTGSIFKIVFKGLEKQRVDIQKAIGVAAA